MSTLACAKRLVVLELFVVIGDGLARSLDQTKLELFIVFVTEAESGLAVTALSGATPPDRRGGGLSGGLDFSFFGMFFCCCALFSHDFFLSPYTPLIGGKRHNFSGLVR